MNIFATVFLRPSWIDEKSDMEVSRLFNQKIKSTSRIKVRGCDGIITQDELIVLASNIEDIYSEYKMLASYNVVWENIYIPKKYCIKTPKEQLPEILGRFKNIKHY